MDPYPSDSDEILTRYPEADIAVLPTYADINLLMLAGLPAVTTGVAAIPDWLGEAGHCRARLVQILRRATP